MTIEELLILLICFILLTIVYTIENIIQLGEK